MKTRGNLGIGSKNSTLRTQHHTRPYSVMVEYFQTIFANDISLHLHFFICALCNKNKEAVADEEPLLFL